jgi:anaerobic selenocysteine-containing dehydrogenase
MLDASTAERTILTACNRDCGDACSIVATVADNRVTKLAGNSDHPVTKGFLCQRTSRFLERQYSPERLTTPLVRKGDRFEPATWDEVLSRIARTMLQIRDESGSAAILHYRCGGSMGMMKLVTDYFFEKFGPVTIKTGDVCTGAGDAAQLTDFGTVDSHDLFDLLNSKTIILWGKNPYVSQVHLLPVLRDAKKRGARLILIDPVHHQTAQLCDRFIQPRPGGDTALAMAMARSLYESGRVDESADAYCDNGEEFRSLTFSRSAEQWAELADVSPADVTTLTDAYADGPSAILAGWGMQRRAGGSATVRAIDALAAISGNLGIPGGGVSYCFARKGAFDYSFLQGEAVAPRTIPEPLLGPGILAASDPPIRMVWVTAANPVVMLPESETVRHALESRELTVVVDSFLTDTAMCADIVLPTTTMLEEDDLLGAYGHHWLAEMQPVVTAPENVRSDYEILQSLAPLVGLEEEFSASAETWKRRMLRSVEGRGASLEDIRRHAVRSPAGPTVMFADRKFATTSGRVNLVQSLDATPPATTPDRPLLLMALSTSSVQGSQWLDGTQDDFLPATVHPDSAKDFTDREVITLESEHGEINARLHFDMNQRRDVVLVPKGGWLNKGRCANALIKAQTTDSGDCAVYYDTPVRLITKPVEK